MALLPAETRATIRTAIARASGALETSGTVTAASGTTLTDSAALAAYVSADRLKGLQVVVKSGTGAVANNERIISASTTGGQVTVPTWGTNPAVDDTFDIYRTAIADKNLLDLIIKSAIETAQDWHMRDWEDVASVVLGSITQNGGFEDWANGTSSAPDGFTLVQGDTTAAVARESTIILPPFRYSCKLTNQASQYAAIQQQNASLIYPWDYLGSGSIKVSALVYATTATRVRLRLYDGTTTTNSSYHGGTGWEKLTIAATSIAASPSELTVQGRVETGTAISAYFHDFRIVPSTTSIYEYYLPKEFIRLGPITREGGTEFEWVFSEEGYWAVDRSRERLIFNRRSWVPPGEYRLRLVGNSYQKVPAADSDSIYLPVSYFLAYARAFLADMGRLPAGAQEGAQALRLEALRLRKQLHRQPMPGSVRVR